MNRLYKYISIIIAVCVVAACGRKDGTNSGSNSPKIEPRSDGSIVFDIEKAACYRNQADPSNNTAEWSFVITKPGRYKVWLTTATIDTMNLNYSGKVRVSLQDDLLEVRPVGDKIVLDSENIKPPYYRADSYMGTFYIQDAGTYSLQVISEKVLSKDDLAKSDNAAVPAKLMSVVLTPMTR
ncbi:MAG: hypothetical protein U0X39_09155 [Bacteroidales bacterium]